MSHLTTGGGGVTIGNDAGEGRLRAMLTRGPSSVNG